MLFCKDTEFHQVGHFRHLLSQTVLTLHLSLSVSRPHSDFKQCKQAKPGNEKPLANVCCGDTSRRSWGLRLCNCLLRSHQSGFDLTGFSLQHPLRPPPPSSFLASSVCVCVCVCLFVVFVGVGCRFQGGSVGSANCTKNETFTCFTCKL